MAHSEQDGKKRKRKTSRAKPGDKRIGNTKAGRKPLPESERKIQVGVYVLATKVAELGGMDAAREIAKSAIENSKTV